MIEQPGHSIDSIVGHDVVKKYLRSALEAGKLPHALMFHGPHGLGKLSMAYALVKLLNCPRGAGVGCPCDICRKITDEVFADVLLVSPRGAAGQITLNGWKPGKDDPDGLQYYRFVDSRPMEGGRKVLIIRQAERMNVALANYLLKLIEEPPSYLSVILITHRRNEVITTIRSRCAPVRFNPLGETELREFINQAIPHHARSEATALMSMCEGRPGALMNLMDEVGSKQRGEVARLMRLFQQYGFIGLFKVASELLKASADATKETGAADRFEAVLNTLQAWVRDALILKTTSTETAARLLVNKENSEELQKYAAAASLSGLITAADYVQETYSFGARQTDKSYVLETMLLKIGRAMR